MKRKALLIGVAVVVVLVLVITIPVVLLGKKKSDETSKTSQASRVERAMALLQDTPLIDG